jgi:hypothetical protein
MSNNLYFFNSKTKSRILHFEERDQMLTLFEFIDPVGYLRDPQDQMSFVEIYNHADRTYYVTYGFEHIVVEELLKDDIQQD